MYLGTMRTDFSIHVMFAVLSVYVSAACLRRETAVVTNVGWGFCLRGCCLPLRGNKQVVVVENVLG